jgi:hypothetical protein
MLAVTTALLTLPTFLVMPVRLLLLLQDRE